MYPYEYMDSLKQAERDFITRHGKWFIANLQTVLNQIAFMEKRFSDIFEMEILGDYFNFYKHDDAFNNV